MKRAFLEKEAGEWAYDFVFTSKQAAIDLGYEVVPCDTVRGFDFNYPDINEDIAIGSVEFLEMFFEACGIETPEYLGLPDTFNQGLDILGRTIVEGKVKDLKYQDYPYFVKPSRKVKLFTGDVIENDAQMQIFRDYYDVDDETDIFISEAVDFVSEYRCFVHNGKLKGIQWYKGDFTVFPSTRFIEHAIATYEADLSAKPLAYTLDVGVIAPTMSTVLVELNDMWAIGAYGFDPEEYVRMTISRFRQIGFASLKEIEK